MIALYLYFSLCCCNKAHFPVVERMKNYLILIYMLILVWTLDYCTTNIITFHFVYEHSCKSSEVTHVICYLCLPGKVVQAAAAAAGLRGTAAAGLREQQQQQG